MPALKNPRHEAFSQHLACFPDDSNESCCQAYVAAGFSKTGARQNAARLLKIDSIRMRIDELRPKNTQAVKEAAFELFRDRKIMERAVRVRMLQEYLDKIERVSAARAEDPEHKDVPGYETGLVAVTFKQLGKDGPVVKEAQFDASLTRELRAHLDQISLELGQRVEKKETRVINDLGDLTPEELDAVIAREQAKLEETAVRPN